jgi:hypothetical protein
MPLTEDNAHTRLRRHYDRLWDSSFDGYDGYRKYPDKTIHRASTRASIVNDLILARAIREFDEVPGVKLEEKRSINLRLLRFGDDLLLWFKKMDAQRKCVMFPTAHAGSAAAVPLDRKPNLCLPGCPITGCTGKTVIIGTPITQDASAEIDALRGARNLEAALDRLTRWEVGEPVADIAALDGVWDCMCEKCGVRFVHNTHLHCTAHPETFPRK